ncbi:ComEC family competence protein [Phyllobacterium sp. 628]|uniref:ComEC/Rec2 family competence protein n=1 Tax=Phyllobacterium sp. 628 TaxID=2718938 RepID=UPI00166235F1|nr:ComEC/Rec2 family competence protein [Phyllobacterium sp. 628]QND52784.1 ComEC family competence protein [Phyllobacterium sp. 628]
MQRRETDTQTSERHFFLPPMADEVAIAGQTTQNEIVASAGESLAARERRLAIRARLYFRLVLLAFPRALAREYDRGSFFLFVPVFAGGGAIGYFNLPEEPKLSAMLFGLTTLTGLRFLAENRQRIKFSLTIALTIIAGMLCGKLETLRMDTVMLGSSITTRLTGRIVAISQGEKGGWRLTMDVIATERPQLRFAPERLTISARSLPPDIHIGGGVRGLVHLRPQSGPVRPGNYDFAFYNYYRGIGGNGFFLGKPESLQLADPPGITAEILITVAAMRQQLSSRIQRNIHGEPGAIAASLITGQRDGISDETNNAMRLSGLSHVLSISGFHMALVAALVIGSLRACMAFFPGFAARYPIKKFGAIIALIASAFYLLLSGLDVAAQRSFVMLAIMLLAMTVDRAALSLRNVALAALVTIAIAPHEILGPSFQMSYSATAALIAFYGWRARRKANRKGQAKRSNGFLLILPGKIMDHVTDAAMTSLVAGSASAIFAAYHFNNTAPLGLFGNGLALPVISVLVMPFAVLALLMMPFDLDWLPFQVMGEGLELVTIIANHIAALSPASNPGLMPQTSLILLSAGLVIILLLSSWLRLCSLPLFAAGLLIMARTTPPDIILSEDGRLVGVREGGNLLVNRALGGTFSLRNWQQGYSLGAVSKPVKAESNGGEGGFECAEKLCVVREPGGLIVAYTDDPAQREAACSEGDIAILAFAGANTTCSNGAVRVITRQDLALNGAAEIRFEAMRQMSGQGEDANSDADATRKALADRLHSAEITYAVGPPERPWNTYRIHSLASRNLPERVHKPRTDKSAPDSAGRGAPIDE